MANHQAALPDIFHTLADPTRCAIVHALARGAQTVTTLAKPFDMALPSFMKHLTVLERNGLVRSRKTGRSRTCELVPARLHHAERWIAEQRALWESRSDRLVVFVEQLHAQEHRNDRPRRNTR